MKRVGMFFYIFFVLTFFFLFFNSEAFAQTNTYRCTWIGVLEPIPLGFCRGGSADCRPGFHVPDPNYCEGLDSATCITAGDRSCVADTGTDCTIRVLNTPAKIGISSEATISGGQPNTTYTLSMNPSGCSFPLTINTDGSGYDSFSLTCNDRDTYTLQARAGTSICSTSFDVIGENKCVGEVTKLPGVCLRSTDILCSPQPPYFFDGVGGCTIFADRCCVNSGTKPDPVKIKVNTPLGKGPCGEEALYTAIGCIPITSTNAFTKFLLTWGTGFAGGIALLLIIYAGIMIITSGGNPQRLQAGKELLTAALMGLTLLLFGVFILQLIGVKILNIPGLSM